jgi:hypothetical protein
VEVLLPSRQTLPNKLLLLLLRQLEHLVDVDTAKHGDGVLAVTEVVDHDSLLLLVKQLRPHATPPGLILIVCLKISWVEKSGTGRRLLPLYFIIITLRKIILPTPSPCWEIRMKTSAPHI